MTRASSDLASGMAMYVCTCGANNAYACGEPRPRRCVGCGRWLASSAPLEREVLTQVEDTLRELGEVQEFQCRHKRKRS